VRIRAMLLATESVVSGRNRADGQIEASILAEPVRLLGVRARESAL